MLKSFRKYISGAVCIFLMTGNYSVFAQSEDYSYAFTKDTLISRSGSTCLFLFKLQNNSARPVKLKPVAAISSGAQLVSKLPDNILVPAFDSLIIPLKIYIQRNAKGKELIRVDLKPFPDAEISTAFIEIEEVIRIYTALVNNEVFFTPSQTTTQFGIRIMNAGNTPQSVQISLDVPPELQAYVLQESYEIDVAKDTIIAVPVYAGKTFNTDHNYNIGIHVKHNNKKLEQYSLRLSTLNSVKKYVRYDDYKFNNTIRLQANGILTGSEYYTLGGFGYKPLGRDKLYYRFITYHFPGTGEVFLRDAILHYQADKFQVSAGDLSETFEKNLYGRGAGGSYNLKRSVIEAYGMRNSYESYTGEDSKKYIYGGLARYTFRLNDKFTSVTGIVQQADQVVQTNSTLAGSSIIYSINKFQTLKLLAGASRETHYNSFTSFYKDGAAFNAEYSADFSEFSLRSTNYYSTPYYAGSQRGLLQLNQQVTWHPRITYLFGIQYQLKEFNNQLFFQGRALPFKSLRSESIEATYLLMKNKLSFNIRPGHILQSTRDPLTFQAPINYQSTYDRILLEAQFRSKSYHLMLSGEGGQVSPSGDYDPFYTGQVKLNQSLQFLGLNVFYNYGPYHLYQQLTFLTDKVYEQEYSISPFTSFSLFKKKLKFTFTGHYSHNSDFDIRRKGISAETELKLGGQLSITSKADYLILRNFNRYELRFGLEKRFGKVAFMKSDIELFFFKDNNLNEQWDKGEQPIEGIQVNIGGTNLITGDDGRIVYKNLPKGSYKMVILESKGYYAKAAEQGEIQVSKDVNLAMPMTKGVRVKGRINLQKDRYSKFGELNLSGIRVTAQDTGGKAFYTLTDINGEFILFIPASVYVVSFNRAALGNDLECINPDQTINLKDSIVSELVYHIKERKRNVSFKKFSSNGELLSESENVELPLTLNITIREKQTLYSVAKHFKTSVQEILRINGLKSEQIQTGQVLKIMRVYTATELGNYIVKPGDTPAKIAEASDMYEEELLQLNKLQSKTLKDGQVLKILKN